MVSARISQDWFGKTHFDTNRCDVSDFATTNVRRAIFTSSHVTEQLLTENSVVDVELDAAAAADVLP